MIKVSVYSTGSIVDEDIDADEALILGPPDVHDDTLVLKKEGQEVAWFHNWAYAVKEEDK